MSATPLAKKLLIRPGNRVLLLNAPDVVRAALAPLPEGMELLTAPGAACDVVLLFARTRAELEPLAPLALAGLREGGVLWGCYPKGSSKVQTDLTRDRGWEVLTSAGWEGVTSVSIDSTWSATRFRPSSGVGRRGG
jgi:hypothetical protein